IPSFARQIAAIEKGRAEPVMLVGDLSVRRDISDVRDIVCGYRLLAENGEPGRAYHFCSGRARAIRTILDKMLRLSESKIRVKVDSARLRADDLPYLRGDNSLAVRKLGYRVRRDFGQTLSDTLNYWRDKARK
ncbi:MAG: GDP-mannose 4,6-dehydratase, partial [Candidatus Zixiibacteriota bacterium]